MAINIENELKPLVANLKKIGIGYYLQTDEFDNVMLENDFDEIWVESIEYHSGEVIYIGNTVTHEEAYFDIYNLYWKKDKQKFFLFTKVSICGFIESKRWNSDYSKILECLEKLEMPTNLLQELMMTDKNRNQIQQGQKGNTSVKKDLIFIGHGGSSLWREVESFLKEENYAYETFETENRTGQHIINILNGFLNRTTFAIIVVTAEDETANGAIRARQNVIHEIGLFQGRLGFDKVAILNQHEAENFSNIAGLQYIGFSGNNIDQTFHKLGKALKRAEIKHVPKIV